MKVLKKLFAILILISIIGTSFTITSNASGTEDEKEEVSDNSAKICGNYKYKLNSEEKAVIVGLSDEFLSKIEDGEEFESITIPEKLDNYEVVRIALTEKQRFSQIKGLKKVVFPKGITKVEKEFLENCESLETVIFNGKITKIGEKAFLNCKNLKNISLPSSVTDIGDFAFKNCTSLTQFSVPKNVKYIRIGTFYGCSNLKKINFEHGLKEIRNSAFALCVKLDEITIPATVKLIESRAFTKCSNLKTLEIKESSNKNKGRVIQTYAFEGCENLKEVEIPTEVIRIEDYAFKNCSRLTKTTITNKSIELGKNVFENDSNLTIYGYSNTNPEIYANKNNIPFKPFTSSTEKAGILMASFAKEIVNSYGSHFPYGTTQRAQHVFNMAPATASITGRYDLYLDCVGTVNLCVYQSTGLWSSTGGFPTFYDPIYVAPRVTSNTKLGATDLFEYVLETGPTRGFTKSQLDELAKQGKLQPGDIIMLDGHVAMYCGFDGNKMICPESYNSTGLFFSNFGGSVWRGTVGAVVRIKESAANEITCLDELNTTEEIEAYAKKLAEAYMNGTANYNGKTLTRKVYTKDKVKIGDRKNNKTVYKKEEVTLKDDSRIITLKSTGGKTVGDIIEHYKEDYYRVEVLSPKGFVITDLEKEMSTEMIIRCYNKRTKDTVKGAIDVQAGAENEDEELVEEMRVIVLGDVTGDGKISAIDSLAIVKNKTGKVPFTSELQEIAGRVTQKSRENETTPTAVDALLIVQSKLGKEQIVLDFDEQEEIDDDTDDEERENIIPIYTREDLEKVGSGEDWLVKEEEKTYKMTTDAKYVLMNDIDLSGASWTPLGIKDENVITNIFEGNGNKITGLTIEGEQNCDYVGLFAKTSAKINDLTLENVSIKDVSSTVGGIVGYYYEKGEEKGTNIIFNNCKVSGSISNVKSNNIGGIVGYVKSENDDIVELIKYCTNEINFENNTFGTLGGIVGRAEANVNIANCENKAEKIQNNTMEIGGIIGNIYSRQVTIYGCKNYSDITDDRVAGILYRANSSISDEVSNIYMNNCKNYGNIQSINNASDLAGLSINIANFKYLDFENCKNYGNITNNTQETNISNYSTGLVKYIYCGNVKVASCVNEGDISASENVSGLIQNLSADTQNGKAIISDCKNTGTIEETKVTTVGITSGIIGYTYNIDLEITDTVNEGNLIGSSYIGGIIGDNTGTGFVKNCNNLGNISLKDSAREGNQVGGIIGGIYSTEFKIENCNNSGKINGNAYVGGIVGDAENTTIEKSSNTGDISGNVGIGGIIGLDENGTIKDCNNSGNVTATNSEVGGILGKGSNLKIEGCTNTGKITGKYYKGNIYGNLDGKSK